MAHVYNLADRLQLDGCLLRKIVAKNHIVQYIPLNHGLESCWVSFWKTLDEIYNCSYTTRI